MKYLLHPLTLLALAIPNIANARDTYQQYLNITALAAIDGNSVLQCWRLTAPVTSSNVYGIPNIMRLFLGSLANATYSIFPPRSDIGFHNAPYVQWVIALSGIAYITLPNTTAEPETTSWQQGGRYGIVFAADTKDVSTYGHGTSFPGDGETVLLTIPVAGNKPPEHTVLYEGPCKWPELVGGANEQSAEKYMLHDEI